ncbi:MAG: hypothetical protein QW757_05715 [Candidatus Woesearchaeota archaeon]
MALKTFNIDETIYKKFSDICKKNGMSMSKQIEFFMRSIVEYEPEAKKEYLEKLNKFRQQPNIEIGTIKEFRERYGLK